MIESAKHDAAEDALLTVSGLDIQFAGSDDTAAVTGLGYRVARGESLGIVGESGSGKTVSCLSLIGLLPPGGCVTAGSAIFDGVDLLSLSESEQRRVRCRRIAMVFQDPMTALNPYLTIGDQVTEPMRYHLRLSREAARNRAIELLVETGIHDAANRLGQYPHEFSGGMRQRAMIAMALAAEPDLLIADEPTSALDVTVQDQILSLLRRLLADRGVGLLFISHDLALVRRMATRVLVMEKGRAVEQGDTIGVFKQPGHPYTRALIDALPRGPKEERSDGSNLPSKDTRTSLLRLEKLSVTYALAGKPLRAVDDVSLSIRRGEVLGLVGESGSGKTSLSRAIARIGHPSRGEIRINDVPLHDLQGSALRAQRRSVQMVFQDPYSSLDPRMTIHDSIAEPVRLHHLASGREAVTQRVLELLEAVELDTSWAHRFPHEFSGGQRQRVAIARALAAEPELLIADEPVSALDVTIQARILNLLLRLVEQRGFAMLFITHDLAVVRKVADRTAVMQAGCIVECEDTETIFTAPQTSYTKQLLQASGSDGFTMRSDDGQR